MQGTALKILLLPETPTAHHLPKNNLVALVNVVASLSHAIKSVPELTAFTRSGTRRLRPSTALASLD